MASLERTTPFRLLESHVLNGVGAGLLQPLHLDQGCRRALLGNQIVSQVTDEVFYTRLLEMQEVPDRSE